MDTAVKTEGGIETAVIVVTAIGACQDATLDAMMTSGHDEIGISLKGVMTVVGRLPGLAKAIAMNSPCKWEHAIAQRMLAHRRRKRSLPLT